MAQISVGSDHLHYGCYTQSGLLLPEGKVLTVVNFCFYSTDLMRKPCVNYCLVFAEILPEGHHSWSASFNRTLNHCSHVEKEIIKETTFISKPSLANCFCGCV